MNTATRNARTFRLKVAISLFLALGLAACGASFEEGSYAAAGSGTIYEFGPNSEGRLIGGVPGNPAFTYEVESDRVVVSYGQGQPEAILKRIDSKTLERPDGIRLILQE